MCEQVSKYSPPAVEYAYVGRMYEVAGWICKFVRFRDLELGDKFFLPRSKDEEDWLFLGTCRTVFEKEKPRVTIKSINFVANAHSLRRDVSIRCENDDIVLCIQRPHQEVMKCTRS